MGLILKGAFIMDVAEIAKAAEELGCLMAAREPLGFEVGAMNVWPPPVLVPKSFANDYCLSVQFYRNGEEIANIYGFTHLGPVPGVMYLEYSRIEGWRQRGLGDEILRRLVYGMYLSGFAFVCSKKLSEKAIDMFRTPGFSIIHSDTNIREGLERGIPIKEIICGGVKTATPGRCRAIANFRDPDQCRALFKNMRLPLSVLGNG
jgi:hypothetical protein